MLPRLIAGIAAAAVIAVAAHRAGTLTWSGAVAAAAIGAMGVAAGWPWAALLILYFVVAVAWSRAGADAKAERTSGVLAKGGRRDAAQVLANGGVFALAALVASLISPSTASVVAIAALGALAASSADTLATEVGTLAGGTPRSLIGWCAVPPGTSGGVTVAGTLAMIAGAVLIALAARAMALTEAVAAVVLGGVAGAVADSVLGAALQERRWCPQCQRATERSVHDCGTPTEFAGGIAWLDNDVVNLFATIVGAAVAAALSRI